MSDDVKETVVAVLPETGANAGEEYVLKGNELVSTAASFKITCEQDYIQAGELGRNIKGKTSAVTEFFKPLKEAAYKAHKQICDREKEVLKPFVEAEKIVKNSISQYLTEQERKRKAEEEKIRKLSEMNIDESIERAAQLESAGKKDEAERLLENTIAAENYIKNGVPFTASEPVKAKGVRAVTGYEITEIKSSEVPVDFAGVEIRPVDRKAVIRLIKASNGTIKIPGISYKKVTNISLRK